MKVKKKSRTKTQSTYQYTYLFRVHGAGGEMMVGSVSEEFIKFWEKRDDDELIEHIRSYGDDAEVKESPEINDEYRFAQLDELSDVLHTELACIDCSIHIQEIAPSSENGKLPSLVSDPIMIELPEGVKGGVEIDFTSYSKRKVAAKSSKVKPVISSIYWEVGEFLTGVIRTNSAFDKTKLGLGLIKTDFGLFINTWTYEGKVIETEFVPDGVKVKGADVKLGWIPTPTKRSSRRK
jgi:hypothetical protein